LAHIDQNRIQLDAVDISKHPAKIVLKDLIACLPLEEIINTNEELERKTKQHGKLQNQIDKSEKKLSGPFAQRAKPEIVKRERNNLEELQSKIKLLEELIIILKKL